MKTQFSSLLRASALAACMLTVLPNAFAGPSADTPPAANKPAAANTPPVAANPQIVTNEELRTRMLNTLDNVQGIAAGIGMTEILKDQIESARASVLSASPQELEAIPPNLYNSMSILETSSGQMRLTYDPKLQPKNPRKSSVQRAEQGMTIQSAGADYDDTNLDDPVYPNEQWSFSFEGGEPDGDPDDVDGGSGSEGGACFAPGSTYRARVAALNAAIVANAVNDIADHFCEFVILGFNVAPLCIVTEVVAAITTGIDENMSLCNEHIGAAEVSATWEGLKTVHGNVQHVHDDLADVDSDVATHHTEITNQLTTHDTNIDGDLAAHDTNIDGDLAAHDTNIDGDLAAHDMHINMDLEQHDADIKARLGEIQGTVDENQRLITISMARQLELLRLMITPSGQRVINEDVLTCTGADCPTYPTLQLCPNGSLQWNCGSDD